MGWNWGNRWQSGRKQGRGQLVFWLAITLFLLLNLPRLLQNPSLFADDASPVIITEFLARNQTGLTDDEGNFVDWIELYNQSSQSVNLEGWSLTDDPALPTKWLFPAVTLPPQSYLVVFASGKNGVTVPSESATGDGALPILHTNFRLHGSGGFLALYPPTTRRFLDSYGIHYGAQRVDVSYGRAAATKGAPTTESASIAYAFFTDPTPGAPNDLASQQLPQAGPVAFSQPHGLYDTPLQLTLSTDSADAQIWYTTDGTIPTAETAQTYSAPLVINGTTVIRAVAVGDGLLPSPLTTQSYLFPTTVLAQSNNAAQMPDTWGTHRITFGGGIAGEPVQADYAMDPRITQDPRYQPALLRGLRALSSLALTLPPDAFAALYSDPQGRGVETEQAVSVELLPTSAEPGFQLDAG
ncbi:MAG: chitobiase/beta-hexosaminidase C-terminal domain-containing protein, partial [Caldilineaceae bacterium]|nr:chitobiase/beta-hexosaminidase C-terminal domain-containing protein [Caldilineaceae bacterium]